jgi:hypothetical protein
MVLFRAVGGCTTVTVARRFRAVALFAVVSGCFLALAVASASASSDVESLLHHSLSDARAAGSVRAVQTTVRPSSSVRANSVTGSVTDAAGADGHQILTGSGIYGQILVVNNLLYVKGSNKKSLQAGLAVAPNPALVNRWVHVTRADDMYQRAIAGVTLPSIVKEITPTGSLSEKPTTFDGRSVTAIEGGKSGSENETLYVASSANPIPVGARFWLQFSLTSTIVTFSRWGEHVVTKPPANALPCGPACYPKT